MEIIIHARWSATEDTTTVRLPDILRALLLLLDWSSETGGAEIDKAHRRKLKRRAVIFVGSLQEKRNYLILSWLAEVTSASRPPSGRLNN
jgi:hypothetical protein